MAPTMADVLALQALAVGGARVVAGANRLDTPVRWAHVAEIPEIPTLLRGGELVLTTGIGLPTDPAGRAAFLRALADVPVAGLVVELGRAFVGQAPRGDGRPRPSSSGWCSSSCAREVAFVEVTEAVHALVLDAQIALMRATQAVHEAFTEMSVEGAEPEHVLRPSPGWRARPSSWRTSPTRCSRTTPRAGTPDSSSTAGTRAPGGRGPRAAPAGTPTPACS